MEAIQYILVRNDLEMSHGKMAAQVSHASVGAVTEDCYPRISLKDNLEQFQAARATWFENSFTKVVLRVKTKQKMLNLIDKLIEEGIPHSVIKDACRTEIAPEEDGTTLTCVGLVPLFRDQVPKFISKLRVYT